MSTPEYKRQPAKMDAVKKAKQLEEYTIKKVCNDKHFSKKKYRRFLSTELINLSKDCFSNAVMAYYCDNKAKSMQYKCDALMCVNVLLAQLDVANNLYHEPVPNMEYWAEMIVDVKDSLEKWIKDTKKL